MRHVTTPEDPRTGLPATDTQNQKGFFAARSSIWLTLALLLYAVCALAMARSKKPSVDEGSFGVPARYLAVEGYMGTPPLETAGNYLQGVSRHTYWIMPVYPVLLAGWYRVWGPTLFASRLFSILWGGVVLLVLYVLLRQLAFAAGAAVLAVLLLGVDYSFLLDAANNRPDVFCVATGLGSIAWYLARRERSLPAAIFGSECLLALGLFAHPNEAVFGLIFHGLALWLDARRLRVAHLFIALAPYLVLAGAWGLYIREDIASFRHQLGGNASHRFRSLLSAKELYEGFVKAVLEPFGFSDLGSRRFIQYNLLTLAVYLGGIAAVLLTPALRQRRGVQVLALMALLVTGLLTLHRSPVNAVYVVFLTPLLAGLTGAALVYGWQSGKPLARAAVCAGLFIFLGVNLAGVALRTKNNDYRNKFLAAAAVLQRSPQPESVIASAEFFFPLGPRVRLIDDPVLGYYSGERPRFLILDSRYDEARAVRKEPELHQYWTRLFQEYQRTYDDGVYQVYERRIPGGHTASARP